MLELSRSWWILAVRAVAAVIFGLLALIWPQITLLALVLVFGAYALVDGVFALVAAARGRQLAGGSRGWLVLEGLLGIGAGIVALLWPGITALALLWVIAFWAVLTGVLEIIAAVRLRRVLDNEWLLVVAGALSIVFGLILMIWPGSGAIGLVWLIGIYAIAFGIVLGGLALRLRGLGRRLEAARTFGSLATFDHCRASGSATRSPRRMLR
jgi:uncharacterized membrane protein HdeD (DUF308 family)